MPFTGTNPQGQAYQQAKTGYGTNPLDAMTPAQLNTWLTNNVADANTRTAILNLCKSYYVFRQETYTRLAALENRLKVAGL